MISELDNSTNCLYFSSKLNDLDHFTAPIKQNVIKLTVTDFFNPWTNYVESHPDANIFHHPLWFLALENESKHNGIVLASFDNKGNILGVLPLLPTLGLPLMQHNLVATRRYSSLPRTPLGGLLVNDKKVSSVLVEEAIKLVNTNRKTYFQLKSYSPNLTNHTSNIIKISWRESYYCKLPNDPTELFIGNKKQKHRVKWSVNKATKFGLRVRKAETYSDLKEWYKLYLETMRYHVVAARPYSFFKFLWENFADKDLLTILLAYKNNISTKPIIAGSLFLHMNDRFFYSFNGRCKEALEKHANDLIQWEAIHLAINKGYKIYDMGEVSHYNQNLTQFKTKWGCNSEHIYHYYYPENRKMLVNGIDISNVGELRRTLWRNLPLQFTRFWGILTNRFL